jgi:D-serine deaminase-like pyridoxal phosphate-dependent protein
MSTRIGMNKEEIDSPALIIDLDILEQNIKTVADFYRGKKGARLRPHQKGHRLPAIAKKQIASGAKGVSLTSLGLAELYVRSGIDDILITSEIYGTNKISRLCALSKHADITVAVDNIENVRQISEIALGMNTNVNIAVELHMGSGSCGVDLEQVKSFLSKTIEYRGVNFKGLWWHEIHGLVRGGTFEERRNAHFELLDKIEKLKDEIDDAGYKVEMLSGGQTCTWNITPEHSTLKNVEVQAGSYVFSDWSLSLIEGLQIFDCALTVLTRCISRPGPFEAMFDFGMNTCADESGEAYEKRVGPKFKDVDGLVVFQREEHAYASCKNSSKEIRVGDVFELIPPHADTTAKMYDIYYGVRKEKVEVIWPNYGRGLF